jgi:hypothetical protein
VGCRVNSPAFGSWGRHLERGLVLFKGKSWINVVIIWLMSFELEAEASREFKVWGNSGTPTITKSHSMQQLNK